MPRPGVRHDQLAVAVSDELLGLQACGESECIFAQLARSSALTKFPREHGMRNLKSCAHVFGGGADSLEQLRGHCLPVDTHRFDFVAVFASLFRDCGHFRVDVGSQQSQAKVRVREPPQHVSESRVPHQHCPEEYILDAAAGGVVVGGVVPRRLQPLGRVLRCVRRRRARAVRASMRTYGRGGRGGGSCPPAQQLARLAEERGGDGLAHELQTVVLGVDPLLDEADEDLSAAHEARVDVLDQSKLRAREDARASEELALRARSLVSLDGHPARPVLPRQWPPPLAR
mmetsp:Transcript_23631/g.59930  ORF Transcript_23631/g.59930 Transcript_23631/m.59930 type:complete len:286 (-) Transcript_23631:153-1010(-)